MQIHLRGGVQEALKDRAAVANHGEQIDGRPDGKAPAEFGGEAKNPLRLQALRLRRLGGRGRRDDLRHRVAHPGLAHPVHGTVHVLEGLRRVETLGGDDDQRTGGIALPQRGFEREAVYVGYDVRVDPILPRTPCQRL